MTYSPNRYSTTQPSSQSSYLSSKPRCEKTFLKSDKTTIDLDLVNKYTKFDDRKTIKNNFLEYKKANKLYNKTIGIMFKENFCKKYEYSTKKSNIPKRDKCRQYKSDEQKYLKQYMNSLSTGVKKKITNKITQIIKKKPKDKRIKRLSCYIKLLIDISNSRDCNRGSSGASFSNIVMKFDSVYNPSVQDKRAPERKRNAKTYLEYLLTNNTIANDTISFYKKIFKNDDEFIKALETVIKSYANC